MKFTLSWLKDHLDLETPTEKLLPSSGEESSSSQLRTLTDRMTMAGLEVESVENPAERLKAFSVAHILEAHPHPDADKLKVCRVLTKEGEKQIVCGAPNAKTGLWGVYAPIGAYVPGIDLTLGKAVIRGVESQGMLCSALELEMGEDHDGIIELKQKSVQKVGLPAVRALKLDDPVIDFEVTPNRPDWLAVRGIARDLAATGLGHFIDSPIRGHKGHIKGDFLSFHKVKTTVPDMCPVFMGRTLRGVHNKVSPDWLQERLKAIGLRPINALVDITNFITYDRAYPLHVYDAAKLSGSLSARKGCSGESFIALDGKTYQVDETMCVIADEEKVLGLGGIIGGEKTGCQEDTETVFLESAYFTPLTTARTGRKTGIISDARYRFERGVDPDSVQQGLNLATHMILEICGGEASEVTIAGKLERETCILDFPFSQVKKRTGLALQNQEILTILKSLGFRIKSVLGSETKLDFKEGQNNSERIKAAKGVCIEVPSWREDIKDSVDLVEEVLRIYGYDRLRAEPLPKPDSHDIIYKPLQNRIRTTKHILASRQYLETITWSFCKRSVAQAFGGGEQALLLVNPISSELDCMRPSALVHLIEAAQRNHDKGLETVALCEIGPVYSKKTSEKTPKQQTVAAAIKTLEKKRHWSGNISPDLFTMKTDLYAMLEALEAPVSSLTLAETLRPIWHPGRSGALKLGPKNLIAEFGELHPRLLRKVGYEGRLLAFECFLEVLPPSRIKSTKPALEISDFMPVKRDFAFILDQNIPAEKLIKVIRRTDKKLISAVHVFDIYEGSHIQEGQKSLALEITLSPTVKTLTDQEITALSERIIQSVKKATGGELRK